MNLSMLSRISILTLPLTILPVLQSASAQERGETRTWGLSASIQSTQGVILVPLWMGDKLVVAPGIAVNYVENSGTNLTAQITPRIYMDMRRVAPYISLMGGVGLIMPNVGPNTTNIMVGGGGGGEYFLNSKFSFGVEGQINFFVTDISGAGTISARSAATVNANVYF